MLSKCQQIQQNAVKVTSIKIVKKKRLKTSSLLNQLNKNNDKLNIIDTNNNKSNSAGIWLCYKSVKKTN